MSVCFYVFLDILKNLKQIAKCDTGIPRHKKNMENEISKNHVSNFFLYIRMNHKNDSLECYKIKFSYKIKMSLLTTKKCINNFSKVFNFL